MLTTASWLQQRWAEAHPPRSEQETVRALASRLALARTATHAVPDEPDAQAEVDAAMAEVRASLRGLRTIARDKPGLVAAEAWAALLDALPLLARPPARSPPALLAGGHAPAPSGGEDLARQRARQAARVREARHVAHERARGEALAALVDTLASLCDDAARGEALLRTGALAWVLSLLGPGVQLPVDPETGAVAGDGDGGAEANASTDGSTAVSRAQYAPSVSLAALSLLRVLVHVVPERTGAALLALVGGIAVLLHGIAASEAQFEPDDDAGEGVHARAALRAETLLLLPSLVGHSAPLAQLALYEGALDVLLQFLAARANARKEISLPWDSDLDALEACEAIIARASGAKRYFSQARLGTSLLPVLSAGKDVTAQPGLRLLTALLADPEPEPGLNLKQATNVPLDADGSVAASHQEGQSGDTAALAPAHAATEDAPPKEKGVMSEGMTRLTVQRHLASTLLPWVASLLFHPSLGVAVHAATVAARCMQGCIEAQMAFLQTGAVPTLLRSILSIGLEPSDEDHRALWALHQSQIDLLDALVGTNVALRQAVIQGLFLNPEATDVPEDGIDPLASDASDIYVAFCRSGQVARIWRTVLAGGLGDAHGMRACHLLARLVRGSNRAKSTLYDVQIPVPHEPSSDASAPQTAGEGDISESAARGSEVDPETKPGTKSKPVSILKPKAMADKIEPILSVLSALLATPAPRSQAGVLALLAQWAWDWTVPPSPQLSELRSTLTQLLYSDQEDLLSPLAAVVLAVLPPPPPQDQTSSREPSRAHLLQISTALRSHPVFARVRPMSLPSPGPLPSAYGMADGPGCPDWAGEWFDWSFVLFYQGAMNVLSHAQKDPRSGLGAVDGLEALAPLRNSVHQAREARSSASSKKMRAESQLAALRQTLADEMHVRAMGAQAAAAEIRRLRDEVGELPPAPARGTAAAEEESADEKDVSSAEEEAAQEEEEDSSDLVSPSPDPALLERIERLQSQLREASQLREVDRENEDLLVLLEELTTKRASEKAVLRQLGQDVSDSDDNDDD